MGWVTSMGSFFYPPDAAHGGIDLAALVVIRVLHAGVIPTAERSFCARVASSLIVLDLETADIPVPLQSRLTGLAQHHHAALVCLTEKESKTFSLGSLVSLRAHAERQRSSEQPFCM